MGDEPEIRVGTAEREDALSRLSEHFSAGRLSVAEFDERSAVVTAARTKGELEGVFADLPSAVPATAGSPATQSRWDWLGAIIAVTPILAVVLFFVFDSWYWFLLVPAVPALIEGGRRVVKN